jgi:ribosomal protein S18 acetylase RimI-like enzyme
MAKIREITTNDIPVAAEILSESEPWISSGETAESLRQMLIEWDAKYKACVAEENNEVVGAACFIAERILAGGGCICFLIIREGKRRQGIGRQLMGFIERKAFLKTDSLFLSVPASNESGLKFLDKLGYQKLAAIGDGTGLEGEDYILRKASTGKGRQVRRVNPSADLVTSNP